MNIKFTYKKKKQNRKSFITNKHPRKFIKEEEVIGHVNESCQISNMHVDLKEKKGRKKATSEKYFAY